MPESEEEESYRDLILEAAGELESAEEKRRAARKHLRALDDQVKAAQSEEEKLQERLG